MKQLTAEEANAVLAEKVMGWVYTHKSTDNGFLYHSWCKGGVVIMTIGEWNPAINVAQALQCLEAWRKGDLRRSYHISSAHESSESVQFVTLFGYEQLDSYDNYFHITSSNTNLAHAICNAILQAIGAGQIKDGE